MTGVGCVSCLALKQLKSVICGGVGWGVEGRGGSVRVLYCNAAGPLYVKLTSWDLRTSRSALNGYSCTVMFKYNVLQIGFLSEQSP